MASTTASAEFKKIEKAGKAAAKKIGDVVHRFPEAASVGDYWRQGDIYITLLSGIPQNATPQQKPNAQLAPGSTRGSRHCLSTIDGVTIYDTAKADALTGPVIEVRNECVITHPEHAHVALPPGVYGITYQRAMALELRRVAD